MRDRFNEWVSRHDVAWELGMAALAIVFVAIGFAIDQVEPAVRLGLAAVEILLTVVFVAEFAVRFGAARDRAAYRRGHWVDLLALAPPLRGARPLRLLRLLRWFGPSLASTGRRSTSSGWSGIGASPGW